jgi:hypothetical protein
MLGRTILLTYASLALLAGGAVAQSDTPAAPGTPGAETGARPAMCTNDRSKVDAHHVYSSECPSASAVQQPDGTWAPTDEGPGETPATGAPDTTPDRTAPDMGPGSNY